MKFTQLSENTFDLQRKQAEWQTLFRLNTEPKQLIDFKVACHYNQTSPDSTFTQKEIVSLATTTGRITLSNNRLIMTNKGEKKEREIADSEKKELLSRYFNINFFTDE